MASAGTVTVDFAAETAKFTAELRKVNQSIQGVGQQFDTVGRIAKNVFAAVSFAAITSQLTSLISKSLELGGAIDDASKKAGISAEAFSELTFAAKLGGVGMEDLTSAFAKFQQELSRGGEKIRSLGIDLERLRSLEPDRQFELIAEAISQIEDPAIRAGAAIEVFGRSGANLLPLFEDGAKGIRAAREEAQRLGVTLSTENAQALAKAGDSVDALKAAYDGLALTLTANVAPAITAILKGINDTIAGQSEFQKLNSELDKVIDRVRTLREREPFIRDKTELSVLRLDIEESEKRLNEINEKLKGIGAQADQKAAAARAPVAGVDSSKRTFGDPSAEARKKALEDSVNLNKELNQEFDRNSAELGRITEGLLDGQLQSFENAEKRKADIAAQYAAERASVEEQFQQFLENKRQEDAQREFEVSQAKIDIFQGGLELIGALATKDAKLQKKIAIAQATINTIRGVTFQLTNGDVYSAIPRAIAVGLFGAAQIAKIASTPETGGGSGSPSFGGSSGPTIGTQPTSPFNPALQAQQPTALQQPPVTQVIFNGLITPESKQAIVDVLREATGDDVIIFDQRSAQAQLFMPAQ